MFGHGVASYWGGWDSAANRSASLAPHRLPPPRFVIYDLGLKPRQLELLRDRYAKAWGVIAPHLNIQVRRFEFERFPPHFKFSAKNHAGQYAWKSAIVAEVADETRRMLAASARVAGASPYKGIVAWLDAGVFWQPYKLRLHELLDVTREDGFATAASLQRGADWNHPGMYDALNFTLEQRERANASANADASRLLFDLAGKRFDVYGALVAPWRDCAARRGCIAPPGSSRANHRQDQSVISALTALHPVWSARRLPPHGAGLESQKEGGLFCER